MGSDRQIRKPWCIGGMRHGGWRTARDGIDCAVTAGRIAMLFALMLTLVAAPAASPPLPVADQAKAFRAAGFTQKRGTWQACGDLGTASYGPGKIETLADLNGDGRPDAVIAEYSSYCFGAAEAGFTVVSKQADGSWRRITVQTGVARFLPRRPGQTWPDLEVGGPGFCFPVLRWNWQAYAPNRFAYEGKPCQK